MIKMLKTAFFISLLALAGPVHAETKPVVALEMKGAISPASTDYLARGIKKAGEANAQLLLIELNTPGGLLSSTRDMVTLIVESPVPVAVYVSPSGAHAASAGTFILYASHIAAMTQGTNLGAATPVEMGGSPEDEEKSAEDKTNEEKLDKKALEDTRAFIRGLAEMRGRNKTFAEKAVTDATSLTASEALKDDVIEYIAGSSQDLLGQIDGKSVTLKNGKKIVLNTDGAAIEYYRPDLRTRILSTIADPNVAFILMTVGIYGLILEFYNPGTLIPGSIGAICLIAGLYAMNVLPVNMAGVVLMLLGLAFMVGEAFVSSFGILGLAGVAAFVFGATILFDADGLLGLGLNWGVIWGMGALGAAIVALGAWLTVAVYRKESTTGPESLVGESAAIVEWAGREGRVRVQGEIWQAYADETLNVKPEDKVVVGKVDNLKLKVISA